MWHFFDLIMMIAEEWCSWRVGLCIGVAIGIVVGLYYKYPELNGMWSISYPAAAIIIALGCYWQYQADHT